MNGIAGVSFRETNKGLEVHVKRRSGRASPGKLKKRLPYSFKQLSREIREVKTSVSARPLVTRIQAKLSWLYKKLRSGEYGDSEITAAILHAAAMEKIAKRKVRHLEEEEEEIRKADFSELRAQSRTALNGHPLDVQRTPLPTVGGRDDTKAGDIPFML